MGSSTEMAFWVMPISPHLSVYNYLLKEFWVSFKSILSMLACVDNDSSSTLHSANRMRIWWQSGAYSDVSEDVSWWTCSSHLSKLVLSFLVMGSSTEMAFWVTPISPHLSVYNYLLKEFWVSFKSVLSMLACVDNDSSSPLHSANRMRIWWQSGAYSDVSECPELMPMKFPTC